MPVSYGDFVQSRSLSVLKELYLQTKKMRASFQNTYSEVLGLIAGYSKQGPITDPKVLVALRSDMLSILNKNAGQWDILMNYSNPTAAGYLPDWMHDGVIGLKEFDSWEQYALKRLNTFIQRMAPGAEVKVVDDIYNKLQALGKKVMKPMPSNSSLEKVGTPESALFKNN